MAFKLSGVSSSSGPSHEELLREWDWCWIAQDAEAAAELGRTLLERNRDLESTIRQQQALIDDQTQEMQHWRKQNRMLRQAAESRLRLCEQLESAVAESERAKLILRKEIEVERQRHNILKQNLEAAEERGGELQRLLDASRASETQTLIALRSLQQRRTESSTAGTPVEPDPPAPTNSPPDSPTPSSDVTLCRLMEDLAELEERLLTVESDWMEEKRKRMQTEEDMICLTLENRTLKDSLAVVSSHPPVSVVPQAASLSLSEELLLSSGDYNSAQWNEAWDNSGPLSLIGSVHMKKSDEELSSGSSGESGFSDEQHQRNGIHKTTQTEEHVVRWQGSPAVRSSPMGDDHQDSKSLFREIFAVIKQNL